MNSETSISISLVHGGFILTTPSDENGYRSEVFTSEGKLMKAIRMAVQANTLIQKSAKPEADDKEGEAE